MQEPLVPLPSLAGGGAQTPGEQKPFLAPEAAHALESVGQPEKLFFHSIGTLAPIPEHFIKKVVLPGRSLAATQATPMFGHRPKLIDHRHRSLILARDRHGDGRVGFGAGCV